MNERHLHILNLGKEGAASILMSEHDEHYEAECWVSSHELSPFTCEGLLFDWYDSIFRDTDGKQVIIFLKL